MLTDPLLFALFYFFGAFTVLVLEALYCIQNKVQGNMFAIVFSCALWPLWLLCVGGLLLLKLFEAVRRRARSRSPF